MHESISRTRLYTCIYEQKSRMAALADAWPPGSLGVDWLSSWRESAMPHGGSLARYPLLGVGRERESRALARPPPTEKAACARDPHVRPGALRLLLHTSWALRLSCIASTALFLSQRVREMGAICACVCVQLRVNFRSCAYCVSVEGGLRDVCVCARELDFDVKRWSRVIREAYATDR